ncbi:MAG: HIT domain-containing protein [Dehalococcoidia bacterium]|nr:HIT domain-containing protein [Dehalococcoidia bacterium]
MDAREGCVFCAIAAGREPAKVHYEDEEIIVIDNVLDWVPVMLLVMPKRHMSQQDLWSDGLVARVGKKAVEMGERFCPGGYRLLSNFGRDGLQSQEHGHVHVIGGIYLGPYA